MYGGFLCKRATPVPIRSEQRAGLVPFACEEALTRLARSSARVNFFALAQQFEPQKNMTFCGVTSAVIVLNALRVHNADCHKPHMRFARDEEADAGRPPESSLRLRRYTQDNLFDLPGVRDIKHPDQLVGIPAEGETEKPENGVNLEETAQMLRLAGVRVRIRPGASPSFDASKAKAEMIAALSTRGRHVIVNYGRAALGQTGFGHFSPLGAYDAESDSFLVLDVNATKRAWVWAPADRLLGSFERNGRGYLLVDDPAPQPARLRAKL
jgi:hypothetical protein